MEIKEPAAIFSEAGLKMFIEAIQEAERIKLSIALPVNESSEVDTIIKEYKNFKENQSEPDRLDSVTDYLNDFLADGAIKNTEQIMKYLNDICGYNLTLRSMTSTMRGVMNRNPEIIKLNSKQYKLKTSNVDIEGEEINE